MKNGLFISAVITIGIVIFTGSCKRGTGKSADMQHTDTDPESTIDFNEDKGGEPWILNIEEATLANDNYRVANWTGNYLQLVFMSLNPGEVIDLEMHEGHDQFIRIEQGEARVLMGKTGNDLSFDKTVSDDWAILIPAGYWHSIENTGNKELKIYTLYGPPEHRKGTAKKTYEEVMEAHEDEH
ncbi:MAG: cupin domain-containing protein [Bacteroidales bacterium]|nr:cupin domain-containing protein [Bacteroidales bacterium]